MVKKDSLENLKKNLKIISDPIGRDIYRKSAEKPGIKGRIERGIANYLRKEK